MRRKLLWFAIDILAAALTLLTVWYFNYMIPQKGIPAVSAEGLTENADGIYSVDPGSLQQTNVVKDTTDWHEKFADQFTDTVVATDSSRGMFLEEMSQLFEQLGCKAAYNLDGGHCSFMTFQGKVANHPYKPEHEISDGIFITEGSR